MGFFVAVAGGNAAEEDFSNIKIHDLEKIPTSPLFICYKLFFDLMVIRHCPNFLAVLFVTNGALV